MSCKYDKIRQHVLRSEVDAVMVGANTVRIDNPSLTLKYYPGKNPLRVIVTDSGNVDPNLRVFTLPPATIVYTRNNTDSLKELAIKGVIIRYFSQICEIITDLYSNFSVKRVMVEGGGRLNWSLVKDNCVDEIRLTVSPRIFGAGISIVEGEGFIGKISPNFQLHSAYICQCGQEVILNYKKTDKKD